MIGELIHIASKEIALRTPAIDYHLKSEVSIMLHCQLCFNPLHRITNQELFEKHLYNQSSLYKKHGQFPL